MRFRIVPFALAALGAIAAPSLLARATAAPPEAPSVARAPSECRGAIQHPLAVRVRPLDVVARGATVRFEVEIETVRPLSAGEVRLVSTGGATLSGRARDTFGALEPGETARARFAVAVPREGHRFLLQFEVRGEGEGGLARRGATYNLLPDGPLDPGRWFTTPEGVKIAEFHARRIDR